MEFDFRAAVEKANGPGGRPRILNNPEQAIEMIQDYINNPPIRYVADKDGSKNLAYPVYTITGLCLHLGICRRSFYAYKDYPEFMHIIKTAQQFIECKYEESLGDRNPTGSIFALKNMGWSDKLEQEISGPNKGPVEWNLQPIAASKPPEDK